MGTPLSKGGKPRGQQADPRRLAQVAPVGRPVSPPAPSEPASTPVQEDSGLNNLQRALQGFKLALPFVQKLLPLLDGPVASVVSNLLAPQPQPSVATQVAPSLQASAPQQPAVQVPEPQQITVDLRPIEDGLKRLQNGHRELHIQAAEQNTSIKRVEDQLEMVREATDRNTLEQQELMEDLKGISKKVNIVTLVVISMLLGSVLLNLILYLHIQRVLP
jgi:hypothetical protein